MESTSWSLRLALALVVASLIWAAAIALTRQTRVVADRAGRATPDVAIPRPSVPAGSPALPNRISPR
jgi:hypothetical protein